MAGSGYPILNNGTFGLVPAIAELGRHMPFIAVSRLIAAAIILTASPSTWGNETPQSLTDPLLGLRYKLAQVQFEPVSAALTAACPVLAGSERMNGVWFIYARTLDASGKTYYVIDGYEIRHRPEPPDLSRYEVSGFGMIIGHTLDQCEVIEADARQVFQDRVFEDALPQHVMKRLADDYVSRMLKAFGGVDKLTAEIARQRVKLDSLPEELSHAIRDIRRKNGFYKVDIVKPTPGN